MKKLILNKCNIHERIPKSTRNLNRIHLLLKGNVNSHKDVFEIESYSAEEIQKNLSFKKITGKELIELAWTVIEDVQYMLGGMVTFLEAENVDKLLSFYRDNCFSRFDTGQTTSGTGEPHELVQLLRLL